MSVDGWYFVHPRGVVVHVQIRASPRHCYSSFFRRIIFAEPFPRPLPVESYYVLDTLWVRMSSWLVVRAVGT